MNAPISDFRTKGFVALSYPEDIRLAVSLVIEQLKQFCALPSALKGLPYSSNSAGVGYEFKDGSGINGDWKENLDVTLSAAEWLKDRAEVIKHPVTLKLIESATTLVEILKPLVVDFAQQLQDTFKIAGLLEEVKQGEDAFFVRFIHYPGNRRIGEEIATPHVDQSGFTLHLFETAPGLQYLTYKGEWVNMPVSQGETVVIPAMQMQLRSGGKIKALCHRVVATVKTADVGRYSAVCFVQLKQTPKYDKRWGRLQERPPGFNYKLPHERFVHLFRE